MTRDEIKEKLLRICRDHFEFVDPGLDEDLREVHGFDSIDAIELLREIEVMLDIRLTRQQKEDAMTLRTLNQVLDYIDSLKAAK